MDEHEPFQCRQCGTRIDLTGAGRDWAQPNGVDPSAGFCRQCVGQLKLEIHSVPGLGRCFVEHRGWKYIQSFGCPVFFQARPVKSTSPSQMRSAQPDTRRVVLIVDDDQEVQEAIGDALEAQGLRVAGAVTGDEAVAMVSRRRYDLVLLDVALPECNGLVVLDRIRDLDRRFGATTPVILMTGEPTADRRQLAERMEISDFLSKPFAMGRLLTRTREILSAAS